MKFDKRKSFLIILIFVLVVVLWVIYSQIIVFPLPDFLEYWAAGRLNIMGGNPYDSSQMLHIEQAAGWKKDHALMMLNPPWILPYAMFFGIFDYPVSRFLCFIIQLCMVCTSSILLWKMYKGNKHKEWISWLVVLTFGPVLQALKSGQVTILVLVGMAGFLYFIYKESDFWAGVMASLVFVKPQLLYLFILVLFFWSVSRRRYYVLAGLVVAIIASLGLAYIFNPNILSQYAYMVSNYPVQNWMTPTLGTYLRSILKPEGFYIQFIPSVVGTAWFLYFWFTHQKSFDWTNDLPKIILISLFTTPYSWTHDTAACVIGIIQISILFILNHWTYKKILILSTYWGINLIIMFLRISQSLYWWYPTFLLAWYLLSYHFLEGNKNEFNKSKLIHVGDYG